jgi:hypothetical protein
MFKKKHPSASVNPTNHSGVRSVVFNGGNTGTSIIIKG